jgi:DNA-binding GntR family transcriptional regulator
MKRLKLDRIERSSLADQARDQIRQAIYKGQMRPEERLTIEQIAADLGISRTPVREALKALEADGVLRILPRRGAVIERFDSRQIYDRYSVRALLEGFAAERACEARPPGIADSLLANCDELAAAAKRADPADLQQVKRLVALNRDFHQTLLDACDSPIVIRMLESLIMPTGFRVYYWRAAERQSASIAFHRRIARAFKARKAQEVRRLVESHILEARDFLMGIEGDRGETVRDALPAKGRGTPRRGAARTA